MASIRANCRKVMCIGRNYADHITELNNTRPTRPFFFLKPPTSILAPPHSQTPIQIPRDTNVHYEVELGLVIGKPPASYTPPAGPSSTSSPVNGIRNLPFSNPDEPTSSALPYIKSYVLGIDLTGRNIQEAAKKAGLPWTIAKGFDTFLPISDEIPKDKIPDPHNATIWLKVNGETKQHDSTGLMLFRIPRILADVSKVMTLEEGDIVLTGTPKGVGRIVAGDEVECGIEIDGKAIPEGSIKIGVVDAPDGGYESKL